MHQITAVSAQVEQSGMVMRALLQLRLVHPIKSTTELNAFAPQELSGTEIYVRQV